MKHDWPDIPDTPEQRALIEKHNAEMKRKYPNLVEIEAPKKEEGFVMTFDDVMNLIYSVDAEARQRGRFECDRETFMDLRTVHSGDGQLILQPPFVKGEPWRLVGYPIFEGEGYAGLDFIGSVPVRTVAVRLDEIPSTNQEPK